MATPDFSHLTREDFNHVYEPAEDTFLFMDALEKDVESIKRIRPTICVEIGSGSGVVSTFLAKLHGNNTSYICTDINPRAASATLKTGDINNVCLQPVVTDLVTGLVPRLQNKVDILLFNPPYVVTPSEEVTSNSIEASWAGGVNGREVIDRVLPLVPELLSEAGIFYMVVIKENKPDEIEETMKMHGLKMTVVMSRRSGPEFLSILKFNR